MSSVRIFLGELHSWEWVGILLARIAAGLLFFLSGRGKLFVPERRKQMRQTLIEARIPFPEFNAVFVSAVEFSCGLLLVVGALTPLACVMLAGVMIMAIATTAIRNLKATSLSAWLSEFLYLPEVLYFVILLWLFFSGPGWLSVDHLALSQNRFYHQRANAIAGETITLQVHPLIGLRAPESRRQAGATRAAGEMATRRASPG
ncbi:MAG: DoxX family protein [Candidatus Udaeobacter sp.]